MTATVLSPARGKIRAVIFDLDGVILDTEKLYARFWQEAAIAMGYSMTRQQALGMRSLNGAAGQAQLESYFGPGVDREAMRKERIRRMDAYIEENGVEQKPGIRQTLAFLRQQGITAAIATSSPMERVKRYLGPLGLLEQFDAICSGHDVPHGKPAPDIYLRSAQCIAVPPENCLAVEDSPAGIRSAHGAGCMPVFIPDQDEADHGMMELLYARIDCLTDLIPLISEQL